MSNTIPPGAFGSLMIKEIVLTDNARPKIKSDKDSMRGRGCLALAKTIHATARYGAIASKGLRMKVIEHESGRAFYTWLYLKQLVVWSFTIPTACMNA